MKAIILSAGQGKRLFPITKRLPKCLIDIKGLSILEWQLEVLCSCRIREIVVVTGFQHEKIEALIKNKYRSENIRTLYNEDFNSTDNMFSCWKSRLEMKEDFILLNGDTLFEPEILKRLIQYASGPITITINTKDKYDADDMKVIVQDSKLLRVGKELPMKQVNGESIGLSLFKGQGPALFMEALCRAVKRSGAEKRWYLSVIDELAQKQKVHVVDITGLSWCEIDYPRDLKSAERVVQVIKKALLSSNYEGQLHMDPCRQTVGMTK